MMMLVTIVHVLACIVLVLTVLLQAGKGADIGAVFGGASTTIFGSSGAGNFLTRLTTGAAIVFMITSLTLTRGGANRPSSTLMPESAAPSSRGEPLAGGPAGEDEDTAVAPPEGVADEGAAAPAAEAPHEAAPAVPPAPAAP
ncbi:MAG: preprotein translocase subunit SecG [Deltaproteobacteria bacterium]|nr:preprotein translocase subunit SecG [Deltaproteobacteria bacterium]